MKKTIFFIACILCQLTVFAQSTYTFWETAPEQVKTLRLHTKHGNTAKKNANKTTGVKQRLIATSRYLDSWTTYSLEDTDVYTYTGTHGFPVRVDVSNEMMAPYANGFYPRYDTRTYYSSTGGAQMKIVQEYDSLDRIANALVLGHNSISWVNSEKYLYSYYSGDKMGNIQWYEWDLSFNQWRYERYANFTYDGQGRLLADTTYEDAGQGMTPTRLTSRTYDAAGNISQELTKRWNGGWGDTLRYRYTYDANNNVTVNTMQKFENNIWQNLQKDSINYSSSNAVLSEFVYGGTGQNWGIQFAEIRHLNGANMPDTIANYTMQNNSLTLSQTDVYIYNSYNNLSVAILGYGSLSINAYHYYYAIYNDLSFVNSEPEDVIKLWPNPAGSNLNLHLANSTKIDDGDVMLYNTMGQLLLNTKINTGSRDISIPVSQLNSGVYFIKIKTGAICYQKSFIKN